MPSSSPRATRQPWAIDGLVADELIAPLSAGELATALADAAAFDRAVVPVGGGTALGLGNLPQRVDVVLSTEHLSAILDYEPTDLVLSVGAGARLADVQAVLGEHGQRLPIDPPGADQASIGGLIATALWGPLRHSAGTLRDLLIGIAVAHPDGTVSKAGGMVVKNVSGYDMPRLYHGSLGTLGVIVSANFKVLPRPRAESTILIASDSGDAAFTDAARLQTDGLPLAALEVFREDTAWHVAARIEGRDQTVSAIAAGIAATALGETTRLDGPESARWWTAYVVRQSLTSQPDSVLVRCGARPKETASLALAVADAMANLGVAVPILAASPGIGAVVARLRPGQSGSALLLAEVQSILLALADTVTILSAPPAWKQGFDIWGQRPDGFEVMRALRTEFDPKSTINPGRFAEFL